MKEITYKQIQEANDTIKTTDIKGKDYAEVNQRIKAFRMVYPDGCIKTEMISNENGVCIFKANIYGKNTIEISNEDYLEMKEELILLGTGTAYEKENSTFINKTSYIENCETSAVGRALGMCGFGIDTSIASKEEVENAIANQNAKTPAKAAPKKASTKKDEIDYKKLVIDLMNDNNLDAAKVVKKFGLNGKSKIEEYQAAYEDLKAYEDLSEFGKETE